MQADMQRFSAAASDIDRVSAATDILASITSTTISALHLRCDLPPLFGMSRVGRALPIVVHAHRWDGCGNSLDGVRQHHLSHIDRVRQILALSESKARCASPR